LPVVPVQCQENPVLTMTEWLTHRQTPKGITVEDECELRSPEEDGSIVRCKKHDLALPEIRHHLDSGKQVIKLALNWENRLSFILDEHLSIKRLRFLELIQAQRADIHAEDDSENFDADFAIMTLEFSQFLPRLLELFGGEFKQ
jgi:recombination associated protein RdgC